MSAALEARVDAAEELASAITLCRTDRYETIEAEGDRVTLTTGSGEHARRITLIVIEVVQP